MEGAAPAPARRRRGLPAGDQRVVVEADEAQAERWRKAATHSRCALEDWIARALDSAAANPAFGL